VTEESRQEGESGFDLRNARIGDMYPPDDTAAEIGRVTIAAARVDRQLALILLAIKYSENLGELQTWSSSKLCKVIRQQLKRLFEGPLLEDALTGLRTVQQCLEERHGVAHSIWDPDMRDAAFKVEVLSSLSSQEQLDELLRQRGSEARWNTHHPRTSAPGPQEISDLVRIRMNLEACKNFLDRLRYALASALFAGSPPGAKRVLPLGPDMRLLEDDDEG
jgi:hypothetical protein